MLTREIQINEKFSDQVVDQIPLSDIPVEGLISIFGDQPNDPQFYSDYQIDEESGKSFPGIKFDHKRFDYYLVCWKELTGQELEILTINRYFRKEKAKPYVDFVLKDKTRPKFISELAHLNDLDYSKFQKIEKDEKANIWAIIHKRRFEKCYVISEDKRIDRKFLEIEPALESTIGYGMGTILVFGNAEVIYYEGEEPRNRWISVSM